MITATCPVAPTHPENIPLKIYGKPSTSQDALTFNSKKRKMVVGETNRLEYIGDSSKVKTHCK